MDVFRKGRRWGNKPSTQNTFLGRGKNNKGASYSWEYVDDGVSQKIYIKNIGTNKTFSIPRIYTRNVGGHLSYEDNLEAIKKLTEYDAATNRGLIRKLEGFFLPELYDGNGAKLGEFDLNSA